MLSPTYAPPAHRREAIAVSSSPSIAMLEQRIAELEAQQRRAELISQASLRLSAAESEADLLAPIAEYAAAYAEGSMLATFCYLFVDSQNRPQDLEVIAIQDAQGQRLPLSSLPQTRYPTSDFPLLELSYQQAELPTFVEDVLQDPRCDANMREVYRQLEVEAVVLLPLRLGKQWQGFIDLNFGKNQHFNEDFRSFVAALQAKIAEMVASRRNYLRAQQARYENERLYRISRSLSAVTDSETLLQQLALALSPYQPNAGVLLLYTAAQQQLEVQAVWSAVDSPETEALAALQGERYSHYGSSLALQILQAGEQPLLLPKLAQRDDLQAVDKRLCNALGSGSLAVIPLLRHQQCLGMLWWSWHSSHEFLDEEQRLYQALVVLASNALQNCRLLDALQQRSQALAHSQQLLREVLDNAPALITIEDMQGNILVINAKAAALLGQPAEALLGQPNRLIDDKADSATRNQRQQLRTQVFSEGAQQCEEQLQHGEQHYTYLSSLFPVKDEAGDSYALGAMMVDISERKRAEDALRHSQATLLEAQRIGRLGNWEVDLQHGKVSWSEQVYRIFNWDTNLEPPRAEDTYSRIHPEDRLHVRQSFEHSIANASPFSCEYRVVWDDSSVHHVDSQAYILCDDSGRVSKLVGTMQDISERKRAEEDLRNFRDTLAKAEAELQVTQRIQSLLLPSTQELERIQALDIAGYMASAEQVGGDYYDVLQRSDRVTIGIGDVTGHGLESGLLMLMVQTAVRTLFNSPAYALHQGLSILNRTLYGNLQRMQADKSLSLLLLDYHRTIQGGNVQLSGQHEQVLLVRANGDIQCIDTLDLGFPLGLSEDIRDFVHQHAFSLRPGDGVVLYTDGITEAENAQGQHYELERLCEVIRRYWSASAKSIQEAVLEDIYQHIADNPVYDDITLVILKQR